MSFRKMSAEDGREYFGVRIATSSLEDFVHDVLIAPNVGEKVSVFIVNLGG
jgi:hypothetical protein